MIIESITSLEGGPDGLLRALDSEGNLLFKFHLKHLRKLPKIEPLKWHHTQSLGHGYGPQGSYVVYEFEEDGQGSTYSAVGWAIPAGGESYWELGNALYYQAQNYGGGRGFGEGGSENKT